MHCPISDPGPQTLRSRIMRALFQQNSGKPLHVTEDVDENFITNHKNFIATTFKVSRCQTIPHASPLMAAYRIHPPLHQTHLPPQPWHPDIADILRQDHSYY